MINAIGSDWFENVSEGPAEQAIDKISACHIAAVAPNSPAAALRLEVGDLLLSVDGQHISEEGLLTYLADKTGPVDWAFYRQDSGTVVRATSKSVPLGFDDEISTARIMQNIRDDNFDQGLGFDQLWQREQWAELKEASDVIAFDNAFVNFIRVFKKDFLLTNADLFHGAALFELGQRKKGAEFVQRFLKRVAGSYTTSATAIACYYLARWAEHNGDRENQQYFLQQADHANRGHSEIIDREIERSYDGLPVAPHRWKNQELPIRYVLERLEGDGTVALADTLASMQEHELLPVCVMPAYRGNGPYNDIMRCYRATYAGVAHVVRPMHVITDETQKRDDRAFWYENEDRARAAGVPFEVLHDPQRLVSDTLEQEFSPVCYVLDKEGVVRSEESLDLPSTIWGLLNLGRHDREPAAN